MSSKAGEYRWSVCPLEYLGYALERLDYPLEYLGYALEYLLGSSFTA